MRADLPKMTPDSPTIINDSEQHIVKAWALACHVDADAATMIAEQHDRKTISTEQTVTALLAMASSGHYMNTYFQLYS
jgi:hypothetical protein